jgi:hypothetical protein
MMERQSQAPEFPKKKFMFKDFPSVQEACRPPNHMFRQDVVRDVEELLLSLLSHTVIYNLNAKPPLWKGFAENSPGVVSFWEEMKHWEAAANERITEAKKPRYSGELPFPVADWDQRIKAGQWDAIHKLFADGGSGIDGGKVYDTLENIHGAIRAKQKTRRTTRRALQSSVRGGLPDTMSSPTGYYTPVRAAARPPPPKINPNAKVKKRVTPVRASPSPEVEIPEILASTPEAVEESEEENDNDLGDDAFADDATAEAENLEAAQEEADAAVAELFYRPGTGARVQHKYHLTADVLHPVNYHTVAAMHLLQTDNNVQPVMGRVHMVKPDAGFSDKHFMFDVDGDINEGQRSVVERSKKGPFRDQDGRSTVMDRSAHIVYRKRDGIFEVTVRRGVLDGELQQMISKLSMHRMHQGGSRVTIIKGGRRYRLGLLTDLDLDHLIDLVAECVTQYGNCGLEIVEQRAGSGPLYHGNLHKAEFKSKSRRGKSHRV